MVHKGKYMREISVSNGERSDNSVFSVFKDQDIFLMVFFHDRVFEAMRNQQYNCFRYIHQVLIIFFEIKFMSDFG